MSKADNIFPLIEMARKTDWSTKASLAIGSAINFVFLLILATGLKQIGISLPPQYYLYMFVLIEFCIGAQWCYRLYKIYDKKVMAIAFVLETTDETKNLVEEVKKFFRRSVDSQGIADIVDVRELPGDLKFTANSQAEKYLKAKDLRVLVWGDTTTATVNGVKVSRFNINTTCQYNPVDENRKQDLIQDLESGTRREVWGIQETNSLPGIEVVGGNVLEISLYTLAICLSSVPDIKYAEASARILENLKEGLSKREQNINFPNLNAVNQQISKRLIDLYESISKFYYIEKHDYEQAFLWSKKIHDMQPKSFFANLSLALYSWKKGDQDAAKKYTIEARNIDQGSPLPTLNFGFFSLYNGDFDKGLKNYRKLKSNWIEKTNAVEVVEFLEAEFDSSKKPALLFASGWLNSSFVDYDRGLQQLNDFVALVKDNSEFDVLIKEAKKFLV
jgi:tetratricopeptide (TPR) repeat protein